jgi:predicted NBD/HSP70 family sugar kinase
VPKSLLTGRRYQQERLEARAIVSNEQSNHNSSNGGSPVLSQRGIRVAKILAASAKGMTRPELASAGKMSLPTVQRALADLRQEHWIENGGSEGAAGALRLSRRAGLLVAVDCGRAHGRSVLADIHGRMIGEPVERGQGEQPDDCSPTLLSAIADLVIDAVDKASKVAVSKGRPVYALGEVRAIGVGIPFPVSPRGTTVGMFAPQLSGLNLAEILEGLLRERAAELGTELRPGIKIRFAKDGDLGAMALWRDRLQEHLYEQDHEQDPLEESFLYLKASYGLDAGIICHGMLVAGGRGLAGQIGHMWLPRLEEPLASAIYGEDIEASLPEPPDRCSRCNRRYCLENMASGRALVAELSRSSTGGAQPKTVEQLVDYVNQQQVERPDIRTALIRAASLIGVVLADAARLADPTRIVVGGLLAEAGETFMTPLRIAFAEAGLPGLEPTVVSVERDRIRTIELEGAIALALKNAEFQWR